MILALVVPGFVWARVHGSVQASRAPEPDTWLGMFVLSGIHFALLSWWIPGLWLRTGTVLGSGEELRGGLAAEWTACTLVVPACLGFVTGLAHRRGWLRGFLIARLGLNVPDAVESAWAYAFAGRERPAKVWLTVTLHDGSVLEGCFSTRSMASSRDQDRDLFLEQLYELSPDGRLRPVLGTAGVWIAGSAIRVVESRRAGLVRQEIRDG